MKITRISRKWKLVAAVGLIALLAASVYATQWYLAVGILLPFANPGDSPNNQLAFLGLSIPQSKPTVWHYHNGDYYGVVRQGTMIEDLGCGQVKEFPAGAAFHDQAGKVHQLRSAGVP